MLESKACRRYDVVSEESTLTFTVKSTLHSIVGKADGLRGYIEATWDDDGGLEADAPPKMHVEFPVERLRSGNKLQDRETWRMIDSGRFPLILADLSGIHPSEGKGSYRADGQITLAGRVRNYGGAMAVARDGDRMTVDGELVVDIRDFGLKPPNLIFLKVDPVVNVRLHLVASAG
jgi:hypothetical protein